MRLSPDTRLGTYQITGSLGAGGMGEVYRARDVRLGRDVALKVLPEDVAASSDRFARFEREARAVAGLSHPNIVTLFNVEDEEGVRFLTMELVEGKGLDQMVAPGGLPLERVLDLSIPITSALIAAHERGIVHRDLKPSNVMVTREGWVKVLDFGLAKAAAESHPEDDPGATRGTTAEMSLSGTGQVLGTVPYMSPEQIRGEPIDARSDLFALGIILYELASGQRPFTGATPPDLTSAILRDRPTPLSKLRGDLPRDLNRIISRCLEKNPPDRFQTARDVYNELRYVQREAQAGGATEFSPPTDRSAVPGRTAPTGSSSTTEPSPTGASQETPSIAVLPFVNRSRSEEDEYFSDGLADELLNVLTKIRGLRVAARASSFHFKGKSEDLAVIGEKLNVATLLDGSVRKSGNRVRISVQLVKAAERVQLWSETYDRSLEDIFAVQDDIAQSVVKELRTALLGHAPDSKADGRAKADVAGATMGHGASAEAHRLYLQGKYFVDRLTGEDTARGIQYLNEALTLDPTHASAWIELSRAHANSGGYGWEPVQEAYRRAREAAMRALQLAPNMAEVHVRLSIIQRLHDWDWTSAEQSARRALELAPGSADALRSAGSLAQILGRFDESESLTLRSIEQDPLNAGAYNALGVAYRAMGRPADAEKAYRKSLEISPHRVTTHLGLGIVLAEQGRLDEALAEVNREPAEWARLTGLAYVHHMAGRSAESDEALRMLETKYATAAGYQIAAVHAARGEINAAFSWLDRALAERDTGITWAADDQMLNPLHDDPRWRELLKKLGRALPSEG